jgi:hypothetical protein
MNAHDYAAQVRADLNEAWLPHIYRQRIRSKPTRSYQFPGPRRGSRIEIQHTLLGVELKAGRHRLLCPDLATARYLSVFARVGCEQIAVPYDITRISQLADELESSWHRMLLLVDHYCGSRSPTLNARVTKLLVNSIRSEVAEAGAGRLMPEFKNSTKQRR